MLKMRSVKTVHVVLFSAVVLCLGGPAAVQCNPRCENPEAPEDCVTCEYEGPCLTCCRRGQTTHGWSWTEVEACKEGCEGLPSAKTATPPVLEGPDPLPI